MIRWLVVLFVLVMPAHPVQAALKINDQAPGFSLPTLGTTRYSFSPSELKHGGKGTIIAFFASWCMPCREELPMFNALVDEMSARGISIVLVNVKEDAGLVRNLLAGLKVDKPLVVIDRDGKVTEQYHVLFLPTTFFVGADGKVKDIIFGEIGDADQLRKSAATITP
jgi:thiol-disulfide isomerase/thioredoxin